MYHTARLLSGLELLEPEFEPGLEPGLEPPALEPPALALVPALEPAPEEAETAVVHCAPCVAPSVDHAVVPCFPHVAPLYDWEAAGRQSRCRPELEMVEIASMWRNLGLNYSSCIAHDEGALGD